MSNSPYELLACYIRSRPDWPFLRILICGSGQAQMVRFLLGEGIDCYGTESNVDSAIDQDLILCERIKELGPAGTIPFSGKFDGIIILRGFKSFEEFQSLLDGMHGYLKKEGFMQFFYPATGTIKKRWIEMSFKLSMTNGEGFFIN